MTAPQKTVIVEDEFVRSIASLVGSEVVHLDLRPGELPHEENVVVVAVKEGYASQTLDLQQYAPHTRRQKGHLVFHSPGSFVEYVKPRLRPEESILMADDNALTCTFNHHPAKTGGPGGWSDFGATLQLRETEEWIAWQLNQGRPLAQEEFGDFLEEHASDIVDPAAASVLEAVMDVRAHISAQFRQGKSLRDGSIQLQYVEEVTNGSAVPGEVSVPAKLLLYIRRWVGDDPMTVEVLIRFQIREGRLTFSYRFPSSVEAIARDKWLRELNSISERLGFPVLLGKRG